MRTKRYGYFAGGCVVGSVNGLLGGGGGMIAVPLLERAGLPTRRAHATAIAVIAPTSLVSAVIYLALGLVPLPAALPVALGVTAGGLLGARLLPALPARAVDLLFGVLMLAAGARMLL